MDSNSDDRDPDVPSDVSPEELEEALQWLEELTGRAATPQAAPAGETTAVDSTFHGLIDDDAGDLPDWLREAPLLAEETRLTDEGEFESRLDWLAKMAERESIEELPTLEWRRLSDPDLPPSVAEAAAEHDTLPPFALDDRVPVNATPVETGQDEGQWTEDEPVAATPDVPIVSEAELHVPADWPGDTPVESLVALPSEAAKPEDEAATLPITAEALIDTLPPDEELPPIDDLDAAMAWIEELAASQDAPIEDVPSVADRALASKLLMEAGLSPAALDLTRPGNELALGDLSLLEGSTPVNAFVAAEDFADTIVLVETIAADQGRPLDTPPDPMPIPEDTTTEEVSFDEAMAFLDELATAQPPPEVEAAALEVAEVIAENQVTGDEFEAVEVETMEPDESVDVAVDETVIEVVETVEVVTLESVEEAAGWEAPPAELEALLAESELWPAEAPIVAETIPPIPDEQAETFPADGWPEESLQPAEAPWLEPAEAAAVAQAVSLEPAYLEEALRDLDALALPPGRSLAEVDASLRHGGPLPARRELSATVEWLELALGISVPPPPLADEDLIATMPEDPDAVLAWLEQMAEEDTIDSSPQLATAPSREPAVAVVAPSVEEISEADLLSMPDDPDAVIAWLERLAGGAVAVEQPAAWPVAAPPPAEVSELVAPVATPSRSRRRRRRGGQAGAPRQEAEPLAPAPPDEEPSDEVVAPLPENVVVEMVESPVSAPDVIEISLEEGGKIEDEAAAVATAVMSDEPSPAADMAPEQAIAPVPARPRRGRRRKQELVESALPPEAPAPIDEATAGSEPEAGPAEAAEWPAETPDDEPPPTAKPASWVDLLKPLR